MATLHNRTVRMGTEIGASQKRGQAAPDCTVRSKQVGSRDRVPGGIEGSATWQPSIIAPCAWGRRLGQVRSGPRRRRIVQSDLSRLEVGIEYRAELRVQQHGNPP